MLQRIFYDVLGMSLISAEVPLMMHKTGLSTWKRWMTHKATCTITTRIRTATSQRMSHSTISVCSSPCTSENSEGFLHQNALLLPWMTSYENLALWFKNRLWLSSLSTNQRGGSFFLILSDWLANLWTNHISFGNKMHGFRNTKILVSKK